MSDNTVSKSLNYLEAPASWNTKYLSPEGFVCQITLRADTGRELLEKAQAAMAHLLEAGCAPCESIAIRPKFNGNGNGNGSQPTSAPVPETQPAQLQPHSTSTPANNGADSHVCSIHGAEMRRWEKDGRIWYSHKKEDGSWCNGKSK